MKHSTLKLLFITFVLNICNLHVFGQDLTGIRIDVIGSRYSDVMYVLSVPTCTRGFDNGWDGYKMFGTNSNAPTIYAQEPGGNFQVDVIPDMHDTYIAFKAGEDRRYTLSFYCQKLEVYYKNLYLVDLLTDKIVDIYTSGTTYTFDVEPTLTPETRFKLITSLPGSAPAPADTAVVIEEPSVPVDTVVAVPPVPEDTVAVELPVVPEEPVVVEEPVIEEPVIVEDPKNKKDKKEKKLKIGHANRTIVIENPGKGKGRFVAYNAITGKAVQEGSINAEGATTIELNAKPGAYVLKASTATEEVTLNVVLP